jgi:hypothetical protein
MSSGFDFKDFDMKELITIDTAQTVKVILRQQILTYLLRCSDLNINYSDQFVKYFQFYTWDS